MKNNRKDYTGKKEGHLVFLRYHRPGGHGVGAIWQLRCDCGKMTERAARDVTAGRVKTCGTCEYHHELLTRRPKQSGRTQTFIVRAFKRELKRAVEEAAGFDFSHHEFKQVYQQACAGCGGPSKGSLVRSDESQPYTPGNCVSLCTGCRRRLAGHSLKDAVSFWVGFLGEALNRTQVWGGAAADFAIENEDPQMDDHVPGVTQPNRANDHHSFYDAADDVEGDDVGHQKTGTGKAS